MSNFGKREGIHLKLCKQFVSVQGRAYYPLVTTKLPRITIVMPLDAYRQGDLDKAMYWSNLSLRSTQVQPEMIRLRELITNEKESLWERDLLRELMVREQQQVQASAEVFE